MVIQAGFLSFAIKHMRENMVSVNLVLCSVSWQLQPWYLRRIDLSSVTGSLKPFHRYFT
jgi:hypothetical protein